MGTVTSIVLRPGLPMIFRILAILLLFTSCSPRLATWRVTNSCFILEDRKVICRSGADVEDIWRTHSEWLGHRGNYKDPYPHIYQVWFEGCGGWKDKVKRNYVIGRKGQPRTFRWNDSYGKEVRDHGITIGKDNSGMMPRGGYCISWGYHEDPAYVKRQLVRFLGEREHNKDRPIYEYEDKKVPRPAGDGPVHIYRGQGNPWRPDKSYYNHHK